MFNSIIHFILDCLTAGLYTQYTLIKAPLGFQIPASIAYSNIIDFHDYIMMFLVFIFLLVIWHLFWAVNLRSNINILFFYLILYPTSLYNFLYVTCGEFKKYSVVSDLKHNKVVSLDEMYAFIDGVFAGTPLLKEFYSLAIQYNFYNISITIFRYFILFFFLAQQYIEVRLQLGSILSFIDEYFVIENQLNFSANRFLLNCLPSNSVQIRIFLFEFNFLKLFRNPPIEAWLSKTKSQFLLNLRYLTHAPTLEIVWTIFPSIILFAIAVPSLILLYQLDHIEPVSLVIKVIGHQWYWSYEIGSSIQLFSDYFTFKTVVPTVIFDSYMVNDADSALRLLEVDNALFVPVQVPLTFLITSTDVLHSWAVPALGIKVDAIPGRLNQVGTNVLINGVFYGQCSELCGVNHGFMPINIAAYNELV